ncbi:unnamed protein product, partial [Cyprideis torosa]
SQDPKPPPRSRRAGGWADDIPKTAGRRRSSGFNTMEDERFRVNAEPLPKADSDDDEDGIIPAIPDLEEVQDEDFTQMVADAPVVSGTRVATFKELDNDLFRHSAFATLDDIDLRALTRCLTSEQETKEPDVPWTWDILFTEVTSDLLQQEAGADENTGERVSSAI